VADDRNRGASAAPGDPEATGSSRGKAARSGGDEATGSGDRAASTEAGTRAVTGTGSGEVIGSGTSETVGSGSSEATGSGSREASRESTGVAQEAHIPADKAPTGSGTGEAPAGSGIGGQFRRQRTALLTLGIIGAILIGFAIGVLARIPLDRSPEPDPDQVDVGFSQDMSAHHAQAVEMAGVVLVRSTDTEVRRLAYDILTTQQSQIGRMQGWLQLWGEPAQGLDGFMGWMTEPMGGHDHAGADMAHHSGPMSAMPGMATPAELAALRQATGPALDTKFLQLMLRHHQGGLSMIDYAAQHAATTAVRTLAETMATTQRGESDLMTTMLTARGAAPLP
jgi:uncharacterized protein (DUF305 family)